MQTATVAPAFLPALNGDGFNIILQALPLHGNGKLVMRAYDPVKDKDKEKAEGAAPA